MEPEQDKSHWPSQIELEKWLMNSARGGDQSAGFLRKMLGMNPAYGAYLAGDEDLAGIVQMFAKRFRSKILGSENAIQRMRDDTQGKFMYEPLCEIAWHVVGHIMHTLIDLEDTENLPVPREALGQVRMLLNTNVALSKKFNEMRRAYLRELSMHRDRERVLKERVQTAVNTLQDQPVMFYEPLEFVLDETTKRFVAEVIEERMKNDMQNKLESQPDNEPTDDDGDPEKAKMYAEMRRLRTEAAKGQAMAEKANDECARAKAALEKLQETMAKKDQEMEDMRSQIDSLTKQRNELTKKLQAALDAAHEKPVEEAPPEEEEEVVVDNSAAFEGQLKEMHDELVKLKKANKQLEKEKRDLIQRLEDAAQQIEELQLDIAARKKKELEKPKEKKDKNAVNPLQDEIDDLRRQLEEQMNVCKELRAANKALDKALEEAKERPKRVPKNEGRDIDAEIEAAIKKVTKELRAQLEKKEEELERLKEKLEDLKGKKKSAEDEPEKKTKKPKEVMVENPETAEALKVLKHKHSELEDKYDALQGDYEGLEHKIRMLLDKLEKYGGQAAVQEAMAEIKLTALPPRRRRKKKAWERLYEDATRRILDMQKRKAELEKQERKLLVTAAAKVTDRKSLRAVEHLSHLHKASVAQQNMFHDALGRFHAQAAHPSIAEGAEGDEGGETGLSDEEFASTGALGTFFQRPSQQQAGPDQWKPELIAAEFQKLRSENRLLIEEIARIRALLPPSTIAGGDPQFFGLTTAALTKKMLSRAEQGANMTSSLGAIALAPAAGQGLKRAASPTATGKRAASQSPSGSASPSPSPGPTPTSARTQGPARLRQPDKPPDPGTRQAQLVGMTGARARNASPQVREYTPPRRQMTPPRATAPMERVPMPWRQVASGPHGEHGAMVTEVPSMHSGHGATFSTWTATQAKAPGPSASSANNFFSRTTANLLGNVPSLTAGSVPWRRDPGASTSTDPVRPEHLPPSWVMRKPPPQGGPDSVPGRVPSTATLEPIPRTDGSSASPAGGTPIARSPPRAETQDAGLDDSLPPPPRSADSAPLLPHAMSAPTLRSRPTSGGQGREADPLAPLAAPFPAATPPPPGVRPKASGLCVTALRSQESLKEMNH